MFLIVAFYNLSGLVVLASLQLFPVKASKGTLVFRFYIDRFYIGQQLSSGEETYYVILSQPDSLVFQNVITTFLHYK